MSTFAQNPDPNPVELAQPDARVNETDRLDRMPWLPCTLSVDLPLVQFTIGDLLRLTEGSIVETACHQTSDVPLRVNHLLIGWTEFEVIGDRLAVRITDQA
ncbi:MAG: FliM/FliN family flagellar motor C-terminal domain-containing protein [Acidobacteriaceae bacterium]|jgi:flagellar motor switch/type III secretory pathway protein FliN